MGAEGALFITPYQFFELLAAVLAEVLVHWHESLLDLPVIVKPSSFKDNKCILQSQQMIFKENIKQYLTLN
jgi:hypothetical protein